MGTSEPDKCIFCKDELEVWNYEYYVENGRRANGPRFHALDICKECAIKLSSILETPQGEENPGDKQ